MFYNPDISLQIRISKKEESVLISQTVQFIFVNITTTFTQLTLSKQASAATAVELVSTKAN